MSNNTTSFPAQLTLADGTVLTVKDTPALKQFFDQVATHAASVEKDKLYATIEQKDMQSTTLQTQLTTVNQQLQQVMSQVQNEQRAQAQLREDLARANQNVPLDKEAINRMIQEAFAEQVPALLNGAIAPLRQTTEAMQKRQFSEWRAARLVELGDTVIPEMLSGDTAEAFEASVPAAQAARARYVVSTAAAPSTQQPASPAPAGPQPQGVPNGFPQGQEPVGPQATAPQGQRPAVPLGYVPAGGSGAAAAAPAVRPTVMLPAPIGMQASPDMGSTPDIAGMSPEEFERNRDGLFRQMTSLANDWQAERAAS